MYSRISTIPDENYDFFIVVNGVRAGMPKGTAANHANENARRAEIQRVYNVNKGVGKPSASLDDVFVHLNRDGSYAIATGVEPDVWGEDE